MIQQRLAAKAVSYTDTQLVEVNGRSIHTPGERAKSRPSDRPRKAEDSGEHPAHVTVTSEVSSQSQTTKSASRDQRE